MSLALYDRPLEELAIAPLQTALLLQTGLNARLSAEIENPTAQLGGKEQVAKSF